MGKNLKYLMLLLVATLSLTLTSCGGDDDELDSPNVTGKVQTCNLRANKAGDKYPTGATLIYHGNYDYVSLSLDYAGPMLKVDGGSYSDPHIRYVGEVESINDITHKNLSAITDKRILAVNNGGYVIEYTYDGTPYYIRLRIVINKSAAGEVVGCGVQWQLFK